MAKGITSMIEQITFNNTEWLWLIVMLPIIYSVISYYGKYDSSTTLIDGMSGSSRRVRHPLYKLLFQTTKNKKDTSLLKLLFYWITLSLLIVSLAEPILIGKKLPDPPRQRDIIFIVDTSVSMVLKDYVLNGKRVDRMSVVRSTLNDFIDGLKGDKVSVIAFADTPHVLVPLTNDTALLKSMLLRLRTGIAGRSSALGNAVALAVKQTIKHKDRHQIMVLLTDAALPVGNITPLQSANLAANAGLPLYTIAVGADTYAAEEKRTIGLVYHPADRILLKKMAEKTNAKSYLAGDSRSLQQAVSDIERQASNQQKAVSSYHRKSLFQYPLVSALILLSLFQLRTLRWRELS